MSRKHVTPTNVESGVFAIWKRSECSLDDGEHVAAFKSGITLRLVQLLWWGGFCLFRRGVYRVRVGRSRKKNIQLLNRWFERYKDGWKYSRYIGLSPLCRINFKSIATLLAPIIAISARPCLLRKRSFSCRSQQAETRIINTKKSQAAWIEQGFGCICSPHSLLPFLEVPFRIW